MKKLIILTIGFVLSAYGFSQSKTLSLNPTACDTYRDDNINITWSIGEAVIETFSDNEITLTQGLHQPSLIITKITETKQIEYSVNVFPNPTRDYIHLNIISDKNREYNIQLMDLTGKLLNNIRLKGADINESLDMSDYSSNLYILRILDSSGNTIESYKIQKVE